MTDEMLREMKQYYTDEYRGHYVPDDDVTEIMPRAYDIVNNSIYLSGYTVDNVPEYMREAARSAVCAQLEFIYGHGGLDGLSSGETADGMSLGAFSYSGGKSSSLSADKISSLCYGARSYLAPVGLLYKGVAAI